MPQHNEVAPGAAHNAASEQKNVNVGVFSDPKGARHRLLDERQVADALGCSVALLRKMRRYRNGPVVTHIGRLVRYCEADVVAFVNANRATAA